MREREGAPLVVAGPKELTSAFVGMLGQEARATLGGELHPEAHASPAALAAPFLAERAVAREAAAIDRWRAEAMKEGKAVYGRPNVLAAASDGRIELLLYADQAPRPAFECPTCGRAVAENGSCPLDGTPLLPCDDALDLAVHHTLRHGGTVRHVRDRLDLGPVGGIGALLSFEA